MSFKKIIKSWLRPVVDDLHIWINPNRYRLGDFQCPVCKNQIRHFGRLPDANFDLLAKYQFVHPFFCLETLNILDYFCPVCSAKDRDRLYALYLGAHFSKSENSISFLDIAPTKQLSQFIRSQANVIYRTCDLYRTDVDDNVDITDMKLYEDGKFDFLICSHVLEHVVDDRKAMTELHRVLKPNGLAIVMVPILLTLKEDYENPAVSTEADRWKYFGQDDHVRMYSKPGFINKLNSVGFQVELLDIEHFGKDAYKRSGISESSVLYVVRKGLV